MHFRLNFEYSTLGSEIYFIFSEFMKHKISEVTFLKYILHFLDKKQFYVRNLITTVTRHRYFINKYISTEVLLTEKDVENVYEIQYFKIPLIFLFLLKSDDGEILFFMDKNTNAPNIRKYCFILILQNKLNSFRFKI